MLLLAASTIWAEPRAVDGEEMMATKRNAFLRGYDGYYNTQGFQKTCARGGREERAPLCLLLAVAVHLMSPCGGLRCWVPKLLLLSTSRRKISRPKSRARRDDAAMPSLAREREEASTRV